MQSTARADPLVARTSTLMPGGPAHGAWVHSRPLLVNSRWLKSCDPPGIGLAFGLSGGDETIAEDPYYGHNAALTEAEYLPSPSGAQEPRPCRSHDVHADGTSGSGIGGAAAHTASWRDGWPAPAPPPLTVAGRPAVCTVVVGTYGLLAGGLSGGLERPEQAAVVLWLLGLLGSGAAVA